MRNELIGVNYIDTYHRSGLYPRPSFPSALGEEGAGTVEAVGAGERGAAIVRVRQVDGAS